MRYRRRLLISAALLALTACGGTSPLPGEPPPADSPATTTTGTATTTAADVTTTESRDDPPGVPGSPINYDSTVKLAGPRGARLDIEEQLVELCGPGRCGVRVVNAGKGECVTDISPDPVLPGGTITITAEPCETTDETTSEETTSEETSTGESATESSG